MKGLHSKIEGVRMQSDEPQNRPLELVRNPESSVDAGGSWSSPASGNHGSNGAADPAAGLTVAWFVAARFVPQHVASKTTPGRRHYHAILKHVMPPVDVDRIFSTDDSGSDSRLKEDPAWPYLGNLPLNQVHSDHVQTLVSAAIRKGYSAQTIKHIRNVVRVIFTHAMKDNLYSGENPASQVPVPEMNRRESHALSLNQMVQLLERMQYPEREIALMAILTSMTIAEICGLQWMCVNLSDHTLVREGISIPPRSIAVRNRWYRGELSPVPPSRRKEIPISPLLLRILRSLAHSRRCGWNDFVLATKTGRPINQINLAARRLKRIGKQLDMPWFSWQVLRRSRHTLFHEYEARVQDQLARVIFPVTPVNIVTKHTAP